jgi:hypothetical protein
MDQQPAVDRLMGWIRTRLDRLRLTPERKVAQERKKHGYEAADEDVVEFSIEQENEGPIAGVSGTEHGDSKWSRLLESPARAEVRRRRQLGYETDARSLRERLDSTRGTTTAYVTRHTSSSNIDWAVVYFIGFALTGVLVFIGSWIYCIASYGFLLGFGLGWLPAIIIATLLGALWPIVAAAIVIVGFAILSRLP